MDANLTASTAGLSVGEGTPAISWAHLMAQKAESIMLLDWDCSMTCCKHEELREKGRRKNYFLTNLRIANSQFFLSENERGWRQTEEKHAKLKMAERSSSKIPGKWEKLAMRGKISTWWYPDLRLNLNRWKPLSKIWMETLKVPTFKLLLKDEIVNVS